MKPSRSNNEETPQGTPIEPIIQDNFLTDWVRERLNELDPNDEYEWEITFDSNDKGE